MAKAITGSFTITHELKLGATGFVTGAIPIGSLIDVGDAQALMVEEVDYIYTDLTTATDTYEPIHVNGPYTNDAGFGAQLMDRNAGTWISPADNNLISSSAVWFESGGSYGVGTDFFPDDFQRDRGRYVVNDEMYLTACSAPGTFQAGHNLSVLASIRARVVKLSTRDWMAISLETVQNE